MSKLNVPAPRGLVAYQFEAPGEQLIVLSFPSGRMLLAPELNASESDVARYVASGFSNAEIAHKRGVSPRTVANQLRSAFQKLGVHSRAELILALSSPVSRAPEPSSVKHRAIGRAR